MVAFGSSTGSIKQLGVYNGALSYEALLQLRSGFSPSFYQDNYLVGFYWLNGHDISANQEQVFNQAHGTWEALHLTLPSTTVNAHRFVESSVTTRLRIEELPSCNTHDDGLYLDPTLLVCKRA